MTRSESKRIVRRFFDDVLRAGDVDALRGLFATSFEDLRPNVGAEHSSEQGRVESVKRLLEILGNPTIRIVEITSPAEDTVVVAWDVQGTLNAWPLSPQSLWLEQEAWFHVVDGKIAAIWQPTDEEIASVAASVEDEDDDDGGSAAPPPGPPWIPPKPKPVGG